MAIKCDGLEYWLVPHLAFALAIRVELVLQVVVDWHTGAAAVGGIVVPHDMTMTCTGKFMDGWSALLTVAGAAQQNSG